MINNTPKNLAIKIDNLVKNFGDKNVIKNISFSINQGEIFGFLGPNGAGKTTIVKMLNGIIKQQSGTIEVMGYDPLVYPEKVHSLVGTLTETACMYDQMTGIENLVFFAKLFGIKDSSLYEKVELILKDVGLYEHRNNKLKYYSTGMKKKLSLARTFLHNPKLLILDEPTSGLDPESAKRINLLIKNYANKNKVTIFLCTHQLRYAQDICTSYGFINKGELISIGSFSDILSKYNFEKYVYLYAELDNKDKSLDNFKVNLDRYKIPIKDKNEVASIINKIILDGGKVFEAKVCEPSLEEVYFSLIGETEDFYEQISQ